jgi:ornithine cyclodeaminase/alanine dehydrogenase-like protein (mu-crystallin family)
MSGIQSIPYFSDDVLSKLEVLPSQIADLIEKLLRDRADSKVWSPPKAALALPDDRYIMSTLAVADDPPYLALKSLVLNPRNPSNGEPLINSVIVLQNSETGRPVALLDGNWVTAVRTAALSIVAARRMANPESRVIALIGCGLQARSHLQAMISTFPLAEVRVFGRGKPNIDALKELAADLGLGFHAAVTPEEAMRGADLIVSSLTRLPSSQPFIDAAAVESGAFASLVDLARPWLPSSLENFDKIIIDDTVQEATMKEQMVPRGLVSGDLTDLLLERMVFDRAATGSVAFIFRGLALGDFAAAALAYDLAKDSNT